MSAICGIYRKNKNIDLTEADAVTNELGKYTFDKTGAYSEESIFLGCHLKQVTPESLNEILPYQDVEGNLVITADAIIDNRQELFELLEISEDKRALPDSLLILAAYKKWGVDCPTYLVGDFAFVIWDKQKQELFCVRDHVGKKVLYYYHSDDVFVFSTLMNPIFKVDGFKKSLNETYIADYLSITSVADEIVPDITIYEEILKLTPATAMSVSRTGIKRWQYWELKKTKEITFNTDKEYEEAFLEIYDEAVRCRLRSIKSVGIMLSGGLDSASVACLAARELETKNEKLFSFTQVPMKNYIDYLPENKLADERAYVEEFCSVYKNIEPRYLSFEGEHALTGANDRIAMMEQPYKTVQNAYWLNGILKTASELDIGVMLDGQSGNATVSWGSFDAYLVYLLKSFKFKTYLREVKVYATAKNRKAGRIVLGNLFSFMPYGLRRLKYQCRNGNDYNQILCPVNPDLYKRMQVKKRFKKYKIDTLFINRGDSFDSRLKLLNPTGFSRLGAVESKQAIAYGIEKRDPTRDKRLIEFCINLPENQWVREGNERRFIRCAMEGILPDKLRLNTAVRGKQAADWIQRIIPEWEQISEEIENIGAFELEKKYLNIPKIKKCLEENKTLNHNNDGTDGVTLMMRALIFSRFLRNLEI